MKVKGIKLYRFIAPKELYLSGDVHEANKGFCVPSNRCLPTGLLNISRCQPQSKLSLLALFIIKSLRDFLPQPRSQVLSSRRRPHGVLGTKKTREHGSVGKFRGSWVGSWVCGWVMYVIYRQIYILLGLGGRGRRVLSRLFSHHVIFSQKFVFGSSTNDDSSCLLYFSFWSQ